MQKYIIGGVLGLALLGGGGYYVSQQMTGSQDQDFLTEEDGISLAQSGSSCEVEFQTLLAKHKRNFDDCTTAIDNVAGCENPEAAKNIVLLLDASGSMNAMINDETKLAIAKKAVSEYVSALDTRVNLGVVVYGHKGSNSEKDKAASCAGIEQLVPLRALDAGNVTRVVNGLSAKGWTPIAGGIKEAGELFAGKIGDANDNLLIIVSDGEETCGGNPVQAAKALFDSPEHVTTGVIAFDLSDTEAASLERIAQAGGGTFVSAHNGADLERAFRANMNAMRGLACLLTAKDKWLGNINDMNTKYTECTLRLTAESLDFSANLQGPSNPGVTGSCYEEHERLYKERYDLVEKKLKDTYDANTQRVKQEEQNLEDMGNSLDGGR